MNIQEVKETGIIGKEIFLTTQELIVLAELKGALVNLAKEEGQCDEVKHATTFLKKITKDVLSMQEVFNDMFTDNDVDLEDLDNMS